MLETEGPHAVRCRPDELQPPPPRTVPRNRHFRSGNHTRVDGLCAARAGRSEQCRPVEVTLLAGAGPMQTASSACATCSEPASHSENTATDAMSMRRNVRTIRHAMAPRLAMSTFSSTSHTHQRRAAPAAINTRTGVGLKPLQGLLTCGQFEMTATTSISISRST